MASGAVGGLRPGAGGGDEAGTTEEGCVVRDATGGLRPGRAAGGNEVGVLQLEAGEVGEVEIRFDWTSNLYTPRLAG
jgi:hypothetical protein